MGGKKKGKKGKGKKGKGEEVEPEDEYIAMPGDVLDKQSLQRKD